MNGILPALSLALLDIPLFIEWGYALTNDSIKGYAYDNTTKLGKVIHTISCTMFVLGVIGSWVFVFKTIISLFK